MNIIEKNIKNQYEFLRWIDKLLGNPLMAIRGELLDCTSYPAFCVMGEDQVLGICVYRILDTQIEILSLESQPKQNGIGSRMIEHLEEIAHRENKESLILVTTNENTGAIRFYQKQGFSLIAFYPHAVEQARQLKPSIPKVIDGIKVEHELEFEKKIGQ